METAKRARDRHRIKEDAKSIFKLSMQYRSLSEIGHALGLSESQVRKSLKIEKIFDAVMQNIEVNNQLGNNFYFARGEIIGNTFYLETSKELNRFIFVLKSDNILYSDELIALQSGDSVFEVSRKATTITISESTVLHDNQAKNIRRKVIKLNNQCELTGLEIAMVSWF